jgi:pimeloyl-ACP methyl ester carboxylesterase
VYKTSLPVALNKDRDADMSEVDPNAAPVVDVRAVRSSDGTAISYLTTGRGPPVIVVPGVLSTAGDLAAFANALGKTHTVHTVERRGRGLSGPQGADYGMGKECEDIAAVQIVTGSELIFGHSYGGLIALEAALASRCFLKVAVYEPGVSVGGSIALGWMADYEAMWAGGKSLDAFATFSVAAGPRSARKAPIWLMKLLLPMILKPADRQQMFDLLPANGREHRVIGQLNDSYRRYQRIEADVLAMCGGRSDLDWVAPATLALLETLPSVVVHQFPKLNHFGPTKPGLLEVAQAVSSFLLVE